MLLHLIHDLRLKKYTKHIPTHRGFTLIELLIAISILAILGAISFSVFNNIQKNNRDQGRFRDLNLIKQALELYRSDNKSYPMSYNQLLNPSPNFTLDCLTTSLFFGSKIYLSDPIRDPLCITRSYVYKSLPPSCTDTNGDCTSYVLCAQSEDSGSFDFPAACSGLVCGTDNCNMGVASD